MIILLLSYRNYIYIYMKRGEVLYFVLSFFFPTLSPSHLFPFQAPPIIYLSIIIKCMYEYLFL